LDDLETVRRGHIAHLNRDSSDSKFDNLVFLCLVHHDEYDSKPSQSKGFSVSEVREYRDRLYAKNPAYKSILQNVPEIIVPETSADLETSPYEIVRKRWPERYDFTEMPWRFGLWQVANEPEFFAYKAGNRIDGVCLIERIDIPDGRIAIACIQTPGNPGNSITNCVEELCFQVCERFELPADKLIWLEHYDHDIDNEWRLVTFGRTPPNDPFEAPTWTVMTARMWRDLRLRPKNTLKRNFLGFESKIKKLFNWPTENLI
jgi:hypothetical protein